MSALEGKFGADSMGGGEKNCCIVTLNNKCAVFKGWKHMMATKFLIIFNLLDEKKASQQFLISFLDISSPEQNTSCLEYVLFAEMDEKTGTNCSAVGNNPKP